MANKPIGPIMLKEIIRLKIKGYSHKKISSLIGKSRPVIIKYVKAFETSGFTYQELLSHTEWEIHELFELNTHNKQSTNTNIQLQNFFSYAEKEIHRTGMTKYILWEEYKEKNPQGIMYSRFCFHFNKWLKNTDSYMPINHIAGDKLYVDHTGKKLKIVDADTGEIQEKEVFVATLGASQYTYVEACDSQKLPDYIKALENALHFFGGVPACVVPDNLKSAVTKACKYEPEINKHLADFATHYDIAIMPTRSRKPKDKALVEGAVKIVYSRIYTKIRNEEFHSLDELNAAILVKLKDYNDVKFQERDCSRRDLFEELDKPALRALPTKIYELKDYKQSTVQKNSHIFISKDKNYYSVPHTYVGKKVSVIISSKTVEIYSKYKRIAFHKRSNKTYQYITIKEHMPSNHRFVQELSSEKITRLSESAGESTRRYIQVIIDSHSYQESSYKSCLGILSLAKKVGDERLNMACKRALSFDAYSYKIIKNILDKGLDTIEKEDTQDISIPKHNNIRGAEYYNKN